MRPSRRGGGATAACLAIVLAMAVPAGADLISGVGAIPNPFSPNGDGVYDRTAVHYTLADSAAVAIAVADSAGAELLVLWSGVEPPGTNQHFWDGTVDEVTVPDGDYLFLIEAIALAGGVDDASSRFTVDTAAPVVARLDAVPSRFTPDGDGVGDSLSISFELEDPGPGDVVTISVLDAGSTSVRSFAFAAGVGSAIISWGGADDEGAAVDDGLYYVSLEAVDAAGNTAEEGSLVELDTSPPLVEVEYTDPEAGVVRVESTDALVEGLAYDPAGVVSVEVSTDGETWIAAATAGEDTVRWEVAVQCTACVPDSVDGLIELRVRARDGAITAGGGYVNGDTTDPPIATADVIFDVAGPITTGSEITDDDDVYYSGQTIHISTEWDEGGYEILAGFGAVDSEFDVADVDVTDSGDGTYAIAYTLSLGNTLPPVVGAAIPITATDAFGRDQTDASVTVTVLEGSGVADFLTVDRNAMNPGDGERVTISLAAYDGAVLISIYNMAGTLVRTLDETDEDEGEYSASWDGRNDAGDVVASGVYFMHVETDDGDAVRKVAVVK